jgi:hypothetical protein
MGSLARPRASLPHAYRLLLFRRDARCVKTATRRLFRLDRAGFCAYNDALRIHQPKLRLLLIQGIQATSRLYFR